MGKTSDQKKLAKAEKRSAHFREVPRRPLEEVWRDEPRREAEVHFREGQEAGPNAPNPYSR